ncbi:LPP20 family lipoprotein [Brucepastera parasyntrophica]|uniref:LPP20 family lipoprotein n=1 Tax=Brucepastera parasyntrophica TaxID=2880008 RepID=UPI00210F219F|nr:LPP20 family lipoprotein [Brucepastera parasyntrophica]ULQ60835.1 LPP20 family lipoprotein [Brucepastera parasyntrophica]
MYKIIRNSILAVFFCVILMPVFGGGSSDKKTKNSQPEWVMNPKTVYPDAQYVSAVGSGRNREAAEKSAFAALVGVFGQNVKGEITVSARYSEAVAEGRVQSSTESATIDEAIKTSVDMDTLVGAEIKSTWSDGDKTTYAVAVMEKAKATLLYSDLLKTNEATITKLVDIPAGEKETLDAYARFNLAAEIGDANTTFLNVLSVISPATAAASRGSVRTGDEFRLECVKIAQAIPISVTVQNDVDGRIKAAFTQVFSAAGFKSGGAGSRYALNAVLSFSPVDMGQGGADNKFVRYTIDARLTDTQTGLVLIPYSANGREGHLTVSEAENRALRTAEKKVNTDFSDKFAQYLSHLSTK